MLINELIFKNETSTEHSIFVSEKVIFPVTTRDISSIKIPGRDGEVHIDNGRYEQIQIPIKFNYKSNNINKKFIEIKKWLSGNGELKFSNYDYFFKAGKTELSDFSQKHERVAEFTATFSCDPFSYTEEGQTELVNPSELFNDGYSSNPIFMISGEGLCTLIVNENEFTVNIGQNVIINTDKQITYKTDGTIVNTTAIGDYEKIRFKENNNTISITEGFNLSVIPQWRYL